MKVYGLWHGGYSYALPNLPDDLEIFESLAAAKRAMRLRYFQGSWYPAHFEYVNREPEDTRTPAVDSGSSLLVWYADPTDETDPYPDRLLGMGPRGGIQESIA